MFKVAAIVDSKQGGKPDTFGIDVYTFTVDEVLNKLS